MKAITAANTISKAVDDFISVDATVPDATIANAKEQKIDQKKYYKNRNERKRNLLHDPWYQAFSVVHF